MDARCCLYYAAHAYLLTKFLPIPSLKEGDAKLPAPTPSTAAINTTPASAPAITAAAAATTIVPAHVRSLPVGHCGRS